MVTNSLQLVVLINGLKFELACPKAKFVKGGILAPAKRITGLKTNNKNLHLAAAEAMLATMRLAEGTLPE